MHTGGNIFGTQDMELQPEFGSHTGSDIRLHLAPELPAVADTLPGFEAYENNAVYVPAGTPPEVVARLNAALNAAIAQPEVAARLASLSVEARPNTPEEFRAFLLAEIEKWGKVVREAGIRVE